MLRLRSPLLTRVTTGEGVIHFWYLAVVLQSGSMLHFISLWVLEGYN